MISLTDLRARQVVPAWQEAVAVVQELIHAVAQTQGRDVQLPDVDHIALIANGEVVALPGSRPTGDPVRHAAGLLQLMLDGAASPPELQTLVAENVTDPPKLPNLVELTRQLAFFERPGRRSDVEQLVARAMSIDAQDRAEEELRRLKDRTLLAGELEAFQSETAKPPRRQIGRQASVVLAFLVVGAVAAGGWWLYAWSRHGSAEVTAATPEAAPETTSAGEPSVTASAPGAAIGTETGAGQVSAEQRGGTTSADPGLAPASAEKSASLFERARASLRNAVQSAFGSDANEEEASAAGTGTADATAASGSAAPGVEGTTRSTARRSRTPSAPASTSASGAAPPPQATEKPQIRTTVSRPAVATDPMSVGGASEVTSFVYSRDDADVRPAVLLRPVLPATPPPDVPPDQIGTLELVVDEQGDVESVRLISPSNRFHERMLVAHAKTWKFRPAIRDGRPVKYRTVIRLTI